LDVRLSVLIRGVERKLDKEVPSERKGTKGPQRA
jgi:hypothetical protein